MDFGFTGFIRYLEEEGKFKVQKKIAGLTIKQLFEQHPYVSDFFASTGLIVDDYQVTLKIYFANLADDHLEDIGLNRDALLAQLSLFIIYMEQIRQGSDFKVESITILGGYDKLGQKENISLTIKRGEIISVVGPTGSGKSRLLADIEWMAQKDTPTGRQIFLNGQVPDKSKRFSVEYKLVAQLSQNMNFIMDLTVAEFVKMHAESRLVEDVEKLVKEIIEQGNSLAGEGFTVDTPITSLSGGQSRALMVADTAFLSNSPIVLIDELENAGIDKKRALDLLVKKEKIVLVATHDPVLALMGHKRLVIKDGGISKVINTTAKEKKSLVLLREWDAKLLKIRESLRGGERIKGVPFAKGSMQED